MNETRGHHQPRIYLTTETRRKKHTIQIKSLQYFNSPTTPPPQISPISQPQIILLNSAKRNTTQRHQIHETAKLHAAPSYPLSFPTNANLSNRSPHSKIQLNRKHHNAQEMSDMSFPTCPPSHTPCQPPSISNSVNNSTEDIVMFSKHHMILPLLPPISPSRLPHHYIRRTYSPSHNAS